MPRSRGRQGGGPGWEDTEDTLGKPLEHLRILQIDRVYIYVHMVLYCFTGYCSLLQVVRADFFLDAVHDFSVETYFLNADVVFLPAGGQLGYGSPRRLVAQRNNNHKASPLGPSASEIGAPW